MNQNNFFQKLNTHDTIKKTIFIQKSLNKQKKSQIMDIK